MGERVGLPLGAAGMSQLAMFGGEDRQWLCRECGREMAEPEAMRHVRSCGPVLTPAGRSLAPAPTTAAPGHVPAFVHDLIDHRG